MTMRTHTSPGILTLGLLAASLALSLLLPLSAEAADARKAATAMAMQAAAAFEKGDLQRAVQFYLQAFRQDPTQTDYLYGAARAEHMAGKNEEAEGHYREFLAAAGANPQRADKARGYLRELAGLRADAKAQDGERMAQKGEFALAAAAWLDAWRIAPDRLRFLFRAGRAEHEAGEDVQAREHLGAYLREAAADAPDRGEARALLDRIERPKTAQAKPVVDKPAAAQVEAPKPVPVVIQIQPVQLAAAPVAATPATVVVQPAAAPANSTAKWTFGSGAVATVIGLGVLGWGLSEAADFDKRVGYNGKTVTGTLTYDQAESQYNSIRSHQIIGGVLAGAGAVAMGVGAKLLWWPADKVAVLPSVSGLSIAGRF